MTVGVGVDHLIVATPDLEAGVGWISELLGVSPHPGGSHERWGTANALVGLGLGAYLEVIGPDPASDDAPGPDRPGLFGMGVLSRPRPVAWCLRVDGLDAAVASARDAEFDPGPVIPGGRDGPAGSFRWRLTDPETDRESGVLPFLIEWDGERHPSDDLDHPVRLLELRLHHPDPERIRSVHGALGATPAVEKSAEARFSVVLESPAGTVTLE